MSTSTPATPDQTAEQVAADAVAAAERLTDELAPEEAILKGWLPRATPTDGPAPAP